ncbi:hypothetical protein BU25DRAFT_413588 [Macroventuria anomochaeta]|uniref:Uncharacterized protein n=1 Tax=Macroventuria anomochaeta TaxID=301207 RepID=A0ACB6RSH3_9PLEO|nr:uncharacterized protein BU25DRAFT_413588 [Macroventuria anomochaeta]KAF2624340.1 hypothetical protein BU25DRAFT_413588 [Macroventuria anomochaeta]
MANPTFAELHSVRTGKMGWGVDRYGCLSLHLTTIKDCRLKHESIYVERKTLEVSKVREDDDCQGPDTAKS